MRTVRYGNAICVKGIGDETVENRFENSLIECSELVVIQVDNRTGSVIHCVINKNI